MLILSTEDVGRRIPMFFHAQGMDLDIQSIPGGTGSASIMYYAMVTGKRYILKQGLP